MTADDEGQAALNLVRPTILVVDDDPAMRQTICEVLEDEGLTVDMAADGRDALERARLRLPNLIVLDLTLPVLDSFSFAAELRVGGAVVPILAITADGRAPQKARLLGAFAYLRKPFELEALVSLVHRGLAAALE